MIMSLLFAARPPLRGHHALLRLRSDSLSPEEQRALSTYKCASADFYKREDQDVVLEKIRVAWGSEEKFDAFVRDVLAQQLAEGKRRFAGVALASLWSTLMITVS